MIHDNNNKDVYLKLIDVNQFAIKQLGEDIELIKSRLSRIEDAINQFSRNKIKEI